MAGGELITSELISMAGGELNNGSGLKKEKSKVAKVKKWFVYTTLDLRWKLKKGIWKFKSELHPPLDPFQAVAFQSVLCVAPPAGAGPVPCNLRPEDMEFERLDSSP